jgi:hypothetical protein
MAPLLGIDSNPILSGDAKKCQQLLYIIQSNSEIIHLTALIGDFVISIDEVLGLDLKIKSPSLFVILEVTLNGWPWKFCLEP